LKPRETVKRLEPYEWEPTNEAISAKVGVSPEKILRFDTNTSPFNPSGLLSELSEVLPSLAVNEYPDTSYLTLREALSKYTGVSTDQILVTNGADEALDIIVKTFLDPGDTALVSAPTYAMYRVVVEIMGGSVTSILRRKDFSDDVDALIKAAGERSIVFLCSPNNPTGNSIERTELLRILRETSSLVVVDEAYSEFSGKTLVDLVDKYKNLIVVRTFSKAFSLAGIRVGYIIAASETIGLLNRVRPPNSLGIISTTLAQIALRSLEYMDRNRRIIVEERERLRRALKEYSNIEVYPSEANFLLIRFKDLPSSEVYQKLLRSGIVTRDVSALPLLENCLRVTLRIPEDNNKLLAVLSEIVG